MSDKKKFSPLLPLLVFVASVGLSYFIIFPYISEIKQLNIDIEAKDSDVLALEKKVNDLKFLKQEFENSQDKINLLSVAIPSDSAVDNFIVQLTTMVNDASLELNSLTPSKTSLENEVKFDIEVTGDYENLILFTQYLENNLRLIEIKNMQITSSNVNQDNGFIKAKITIGIIKSSASNLKNIGIKNE